MRRRHFVERNEVVYYLIVNAIVEGKLYTRLRVFVTGVTRIVL
jgi:hypothetical protein